MDAYIEYRIGLAPTPEQATTIRDLYERHGAPFAAYLTLDNKRVNAQAADAPAYGPDPEATDRSDMDERFRNAFTAAYTTREELIADTIETLGMSDQLDRLLADEPQLRDVITFDRVKLWRLVCEYFDVVELYGGIYVFEQGP